MDAATVTKEDQRVDRLDIASIRRDGGTQPRAELREEWAQEYAEEIGAGAEFPPVTVFYDGESYWLADGFHRVRAAELSGAPDVAANVRSGTRQDARDFACSGLPNGRHGQREKPQDRHRRILAMLQDHPSWSNVRVARHCEVSHQTVMRVKGGNLSNGQDTNYGEAERADGTTYPMATGNIGRGQQEASSDDEASVFDSTAAGESVSAERDEAPQPGLAPTPTPQPTTPRDETDAERDNSHHRTNFTGENEWYTPRHLVDAARRVLGAIDLDPASSHTAQEWIGAWAYFTEDDDGLAQDWHGRVWLNPPYSQPSIAHFCDKVVAEWMAGNIEAAIVLTHNYTDTRWFHTLFGAAAAICFTRGRVKFVNQDGEEAAPSQGQAFTYFGDDAAGFAAEFGQYGRVVTPMAEVAA